MNNNKNATTSFSDRERAAIEQVAAERGITFEQAVAQLLGEGLARRVRKSTGRRPANNVRQFRREG